MTKKNRHTNVCFSISTHMPLARHDLSQRMHRSHLSQFLLTCLLRGMTMMPELKITWAIFLLTCLLRGMTRQGKPNGQDKHISTHMPLARHDPAIMAGSFFVLDFYSHASCEAWPCGSTLPRHLFQISTHMPLARHDNPTTSLDTIALNFYSHASCEAWHIIYRNKKTFWISTHMPLARHDTPPLKSIVKTVISTHMPLARHDSYDIHYQLREADFYSHASCEAWRQQAAARKQTTIFLLTCLLRGMT